MPVLARPSNNLLGRPSFAGQNVRIIIGQYIGNNEIVANLRLLCWYILAGTKGNHINLIRDTEI
jgi:hypothetical protein